MALKSYRIDKSILPLYMESKHEITLPNGKIVMHRYVEGDSELEISKQSPNAEVKIIFLGQEIYTSSNEVEQKYIEGANYYGRLITDYDPILINTEKLKSKKESINLLKEVAGFDRDKIIETGYVMFGREALKFIKDGDIDGLHDRIIEEAGNEPEKVNTVINNENNGETLYAGFLIASGILEVTMDERKVIWADNGSTVVTIPNGITPLAGLVEYFGTTEGRTVKQEAGTRLEVKAVKGKAGRPTKVVTEEK